MHQVIMRTTGIKIWLNKFKNCRDLMPDEACMVFFNKIELNHRRLVIKLSQTLTQDYRSRFDLMYQLTVHQPVLFLKHMQTEFVYQNIWYEDLPMFYEVKQTETDGTKNCTTFDILLYGLYVDSPQIVTLKEEIIEFCQSYQNWL